MRNGKGSWRRPYSKALFDQNFDLIFRKRQRITLPTTKKTIPITNSDRKSIPPA